MGEGQGGHDATTHSVCLPRRRKGKIIKWYVGEGEGVVKDQALGVYEFSVERKKGEEEEEEEGEGGGESVVVRKELKSTVKSVVKKVCVVEGGSVGRDESVVLLEEECQHSVVVMGLCAHCGVDLTHSHYSENVDHSNAARGMASCSSQTSNAKAQVAMVHGIPSLMVSKSHAVKLGLEDEQRWLQAKKLVLVVDLDQTLIHATTDKEVGKWFGHPMNHLDKRELHRFTLQGSPVVYYVKIRHGVEQFLKTISEKYELHIYTMGTRAYARQIARILDPEAKYFADRIFSRDDCYDKNFKTNGLSGLFPHGDRMVAIIDDREDVWKRCKNLVKVKPYEFFVGAEDVNALPMDRQRKGKEPDGEKGSNKKSASVTEGAGNGADGKMNNSTGDGKETARENGVKTSDADGAGDGCGGDKADDGKKENGKSGGDVKDGGGKKEIGKIDIPVDKDYHIENVGNFLIQVHSYFYMGIESSKYGKNVKPDVKGIIPSLKRTVLSGCRICFSSVIPTNEKPESAHIWRQAEEFGAYCFEDFLDGEITHVVAAKKGTSKVNDALKSKNCYLVHVDWLKTCIANYERADEFSFPLDKGVNVRFGGTKEHLSIKAEPGAYDISVVEESDMIREMRKRFSVDDFAKIEEDLNISDSSSEDSGLDKKEESTNGGKKRKRESSSSSSSSGGKSEGEDDEEEDDWLAKELLAGD
eukprot:Nk52_evm18s260 gene=Nk52_evmTU18s260